eukprot:jgi/Mesen1/8514/ME000480S07868
MAQALAKESLRVILSGSLVQQNALGLQQSDFRQGSTLNKVQLRAVRAGASTSPQASVQAERGATEGSGEPSSTRGISRRMAAVNGTSALLLSAIAEVLVASPAMASRRGEGRKAALERIDEARKEAAEKAGETGKEVSDTVKSASSAAKEKIQEVPKSLIEPAESFEELKKASEEALGNTRKPEVVVEAMNKPLEVVQDAVEQVKETLGGKRVEEVTQAVKDASPAPALEKVEQAGEAAKGAVNDATPPPLQEVVEKAAASAENAVDSVSEKAVVNEPVEAVKEVVPAAVTETVEQAGAKVQEIKEVATGKISLQEALEKLKAARENE